MAPSKAVIGGALASGALKRGFSYIDDTRNTASGFDPGDIQRNRKRLRRRPIPTSGNFESAGKMGLLTYRRQYESRRGRSARTVRKLARAQRRKRLDGSSSSLLAQTVTLTFPAKQTGTTSVDGDCCRGIFVPSLARLIQTASRVRDEATGNQSAQTFIQLLKTRYELFYTPNWPSHTTDSLGITVEMSLFRLKQRISMSEVIAVPAYSGGTSEPISFVAARTGGYWNAMGRQQTTTSAPVNTTFQEFFDGMLMRYDKDNADTSDPTISQGNKNRYLSSLYSWIDSPNFNAIWTLDRTQRVYIPYGQSMQQSFVLPGCNISYRDLNIAYDYPSAPASDLDVTEYLPRGWPMLAFKIIRHKGSSTVSSTGLDANDAMCVNIRHFWRMPEYYGRSLEHLDATTLPYPGSAAAGGVTWTQPFTA